VDPMPHMQHMTGSTVSFADLWSPGVMLFTLMLGVVYFYLVGSLRDKLGGSQEEGWRKKGYFAAALIVFYAGQGSPIAFYGHVQLFSAHMLQQSLMYLILPPLVYLAIPDWLLRPLLQKKAMKRWVYPLTQPLISVLFFNVMFSFYHIPSIMNYLHQTTLLHNGSHMLLIAAAFHMWFPVFCPVPEWNRLSELQKMTYIFANGVLLTPACALIIFASSTLYPEYANAPQLISFLPPLDDQQLGGTIMKIIQEIVYGTVLGYTFFKWYRLERKNEDKEQEKLEASLMLRNQLRSN
jgi:putative membrane protein